MAGNHAQTLEHQPPGKGCWVICKPPFNALSWLYSLFNGGVGRKKILIVYDNEFVLWYCDKSDRTFKREVIGSIDEKDWWFYRINASPEKLEAICSLGYDLNCLFTNCVTITNTICRKIQQ